MISSESVPKTRGAIEDLDVSVELRLLSIYLQEALDNAFKVDGPMLEIVRVEELSVRAVSLTHSISGGNGTDLIGVEIFKCIIIQCSATKGLNASLDTSIEQISVEDV